jgi:hypothetical protein
VKLKRDVVSALIYPTAVILMAVAAIAVIMIVVIPQFQTIFLGLLGPGEPLPLPTRIVIGISNFLAGWGGLCLLVGIIGSVVGLRFYYKTPNGRKRMDWLLLKVPIIGAIFLKIAIAGSRERFPRCCRPVCLFSNRSTLPRVPPATSSWKKPLMVFALASSRVRALSNRCAQLKSFHIWSRR